jgi:hypothetical protein
MIFDYRQALLDEESKRRSKKFRPYKDITTTLRKHGVIPPSQPTLMSWSRRGWFPPAYSLGSRILAWDEGEVLRWVRQKDQAPLVRKYFATAA